MAFSSMPSTCSFSAGVVPGSADHAFLFIIHTDGKRSRVNLWIGEVGFHEGKVRWRTRFFNRPPGCGRRLRTFLRPDMMYCHSRPDRFRREKPIPKNRTGRPDRPRDLPGCLESPCPEKRRRTCSLWVSHTTLFFHPYPAFPLSSYSRYPGVVDLKGKTRQKKGFISVQKRSESDRGGMPAERCRSVHRYTEQ